MECGFSSKISLKICETVPGCETFTDLLGSVLGGKGQKKEDLDPINSAYRESPFLLKNDIDKVEQCIDRMVIQNEAPFQGEEVEENEDDR